MSTDDADNDGTKHKRLRLCDPDLKVVIGAESDKQEEVRWYHSVVLASRSQYIDAMLANPMAESQNGEISFPDILPATWDAMMKFLEDPMASRRMTIDDVFICASAYDKYDFMSSLSILLK